MNTGRKLAAAIAALTAAGLACNIPLFRAQRTTGRRHTGGSFTPRRRQPWQPRRPKAGTAPLQPK